MSVEESEEDWYTDEEQRPWDAYWEGFPALRLLRLTGRKERLCRPWKIAHLERVTTGHV